MLGFQTSGPLHHERRAGRASFSLDLPTLMKPVPPGRCHCRCKGAHMQWTPPPPSVNMLTSGS